ncbi:HK97 family phage prohead protease [Desulfosporosinus sp.]|uniref:HK97 family phage prohead protease n=1 Tax=Desulfosporosinus sp. TaxID=157907 RepID=UPI0025B7BE96|nr:HK97 family phage prohead protease [Desulfosporosinus sp.]MBC2722334.1 HK97 family phage prohead protease [Desulfosporosinus sp.]MBC2728632.1 HK97 family phage prohead protease [Desulfosporosinus sp.]
MNKEAEKKSPLSQQSKKRMLFDDDRSKFRAISEEVDGQNVRRLRGYPILFDTPGRPYRGSKWIEKVDKKALEGVDLSKLVLLWDHATSWVLGRAGKNMRTVVDEVGLFIEVTLGNTWLDDYVFDRVQNEIVDGMSFWFDNNAMIATDWENKIDVILKINDVYEVSIVVFPAYEETVIITEEQTAETPASADDAALKLALMNLISQL